MSSSCLGHDSHETQGTRPWTQRKNHVVWLGSKSLWELRISDDQNRKKKLNVWGATGNSRLKDLKDWVGNQDRVKTCFQMSKIVTRTSIGWIHSTHTYLPSTILRDCASPPMGNRFNPATLSNKTHNFVRFLKMKNKKFLCFVSPSTLRTISLHNFGSILNITTISTKSPPECPSFSSS